MLVRGAAGPWSITSWAIAAWVVAVGPSCGEDPGACVRDSDCPGGQACDPQLGCVPDSGDGDADGDADGSGDADADADADSDADSDGDADGNGPGCDELSRECGQGDAQLCATLDAQCGAGTSCLVLEDSCLAGGDAACVLLREQCPDGATSCDTLRASCAAGDDQACAQLAEQGCPPANDCGADGVCVGNCADDPDCADPARCPETCGLVPEVSREHCVWACEADACVLVNAFEPLPEVCGPVDQRSWDEDCDGLVDCLDPDCAGTDLCR